MEINQNAAVKARATVLIEAPPGRVWDILTRIEQWPEWNQQVASVHLDGALEPGTTFRWNAGGLPIRSRLLEVEPDSSIGWSGRSPGIHALHRWQIEERGERSLVCSEESFQGILPRLLGGPMRRLLENSLQQGLNALKREAERRQRETGHAALG